MAGRVKGRDHPVSVALALAAAAVVAGMRGYTAITGWISDVPAGILANPYIRAGALPAGPPSKTTMWRVLTDTDAEAFDATVGGWLMGLAGLTTAPDADGRADSPALMRVRLDGKTLHGAKDAEGNQMHPLAALVGAKTNEVPMAVAVLSQIDLNGKIVPADALHTVKATAEHIHESGGQFVLPVKENRRALFDALAWKDVPITHRSVNTGHGRVTTRTIQVLPRPTGSAVPAR